MNPPVDSCNSNRPLQAAVCPVFSVRPACQNMYCTTRPLQLEDPVMETTSFPRHCSAF